METIATYPVKEILPLIGVSEKTHILDWDVGTISERLKTFKRSLVCIECGLVGSIFKLQRHHPNEIPHLNLFAIRENGDSILMTADHIIPKSIGGPRRLFNLQTMCHVCNERKANTIELKYLTAWTARFLRYNVKRKHHPSDINWGDYLIGAKEK